MSDKDINYMDFKELRKEVQSLRDELAVMQRKYEDILYNLDNENFSNSIIKEKDNMKATIKVTAEEVNSKVSTGEVQSMISQSASQLSSQISDIDGRVSIVNQEISMLSSRVTSAEGVTSQFIQTPYGFTIDGEKTTFTGVIYLTDNNGEKQVSFFHDESQGYPQVFLHNIKDGTVPIIIGNIDGYVYIGSDANGRQVATRNWVENYVDSVIGNS